MLTNAIPSLDGTEGPIGTPNPEIPEIVLYPLPGFRGAPYRTNLSYAQLPPGADNQISSFIIVRGRWEFFAGANFTGGKGGPVGPGYYPNLPPQVDNQISSFRFLR